MLVWELAGIQVRLSQRRDPIGQLDLHERRAREHRLVEARRELCVVERTPRGAATVRALGGFYQRPAGAAGASEQHLAGASEQDAAGVAASSEQDPAGEAGASEQRSAGASEQDAEGVAAASEQVPAGAAAACEQGPAEVAAASEQDPARLLV